MGKTLREKMMKEGRREGTEKGERYKGRYAERNKNECIKEGRKYEREKVERKEGRRKERGDSEKETGKYRKKCSANETKHIADNGKKEKKTT
jgi:hypothetical protein